MAKLAARGSVASALLLLPTDARLLTIILLRRLLIVGLALFFAEWLVLHMLRSDLSRDLHRPVQTSTVPGEVVVLGVDGLPTPLSITLPQAGLAPVQAR